MLHPWELFKLYASHGASRIVSGVASARVKATGDAGVQNQEEEETPHTFKVSLEPSSPAPIVTACIYKPK